VEPRAGLRPRSRRSQNPERQGEQLSKLADRDAGATQHKRITYAASPVRIETSPTRIAVPRAPGRESTVEDSPLESGLCVCAGDERMD
jgi:hypothetical protein